MPLVTLANVKKTFGVRCVFSGVSFSVGDGERIGLVGRNGTGKTTLLKLMTGALAPDEGSVDVRSGLRMEYLEQQFRPASDLPLHEYVIETFSRVFDTEAELRETEHALADRPDDAGLLKRLGELQHAFEMADGYRVEQRAGKVLAGLGFSREQLSCPLNSLSGGEQTKAALARILAEEPDLLLLDEPTNHLDLWALSWLEEFLLGFKGSTLIISHDRYFLDNVATRIIELSFGKCRSFKGNYSAYVEGREKLDLDHQRRYDAQQRHIEHEEEFIRRYHAAQRAREARGRKRKLDRLERIEKPVEQRAAAVRFDGAARTSYVVFSMRGVGKCYDERTLFSGLDLEVTRGDRIGIIGPNGAGKTTLIRIMMGKEEPLQGAVTQGNTGAIGYFDQKQRTLDESRTVLEEIAPAARETREGDLRSLAARFLFTGDDVMKSVRSLSGGEKAMLSLAKIMAARPSVMVLDEPTNHLDISSREAVERALCEFDGTLVIVSHDRRLLDAVTDRTFLLADCTGRLFRGGYSFYVYESQREKTLKAEQKRSDPEKARKADPRADAKELQRRRRRIQREVGLAEQRVLKLEGELALINRTFETDKEIYQDAERLRLATQHAQETRKQLEEAGREWERLVDSLARLDEGK